MVSMIEIDFFFKKQTHEGPTLFNQTFHFLFIYFYFFIFLISSEDSEHAFFFFFTFFFFILVIKILLQQIFTIFLQFVRG